ncbi:MAG: hypothetical protein JWP01_2214 [Myxococcales bacterium]|nr:hypothetical protein [Myxococcales bacterium]
MGKGKPTPDRSKIARERPVAYSRRQKSGGGEGGGDDPEEIKPASDASKAAGNAGTTTGSGTPERAIPEGPTPSTPDKPAEPDAKAEAKAEPAIEPPPPKAEPWPDATPQPMRPVEPARARVGTIEMSPEAVSGLGQPPAIPAVNPDIVEDPTSMPGPRDIPHGHPSDPASPPGRVPAGDSRSLRKGDEFVLVYRVQTAVITRFGTLGQRGQWRVVDYPTSSSASNAYAKEVSRFVSEGFSDYRD